jgi:hypothetical protein
MNNWIRFNRNTRPSIMLSLTPGTAKGLLPPILFFVIVACTQAQPVATIFSNAPLCADAPLLTLFETGGTATVWNWKGPNGFVSSVQNPTITNPTIAAAGLYSVTVSDVNGLTASASIQVAIHQPGPLSCNDNVTISLDAQGQATVLPQTVLQGNYDYDFYSVTVFDNQGIDIGNLMECDRVGQALTYRVTDICSGNYCWGNLKIEDKHAPTLVCNDLFYSCAIADYSPNYLLNELGIADGYPQISDNCGDYNLINVDLFHNLPCAHPLNGISISSAWMRREWFATDASGNKANCAQIIYFVRRHLSDLHWPADTSISCEKPAADPLFTGAPFITEYGHNFSLYPNKAYCEMNAAYTDEVIDVCDGTKKILRSWTVAEDCPENGLPSFLIHQQVIKIVDAKGPVFKCPTTTTVSLDPFSCCSIVDLPDVIIKDTCSRINRIDGIIQTFDVWSNDSSATYAVAGTLSSFPNNNLWHADTLGVYGFSPCLPQGTHTVTYRAIDDCGNSGSCSFSLVVEDKVPPVAACDAVTKVALNIHGLAEVFAETFNDGSFDQCCETTFYVRRMYESCFGSDDFEPTVWFCCSDIGDTILVVFRAYDCAGNFNDCMVKVIVEDKIKPICNPPANLTVDCAFFDPTLASFGFATATDNCCLDTIVTWANYNQFDTVCNRGTIIRNFRALDCAGNMSQCTQRIVLDYTQYYYLKMPDDKIVNTCNGTGNYGEPTLHYEDCELIGLSYEDEVFTVVPEGCYRIDRHWKIINWCTYNPNGGCIAIPNPDISQIRPFVLPGPIISPLGTPAPWSPTYTFINPTDSAATNYSIFWDQNANCYSYKQMILVFDTKDPIIENCPQGTLKVCDLTANNAALWNDPAWWDPATSKHDLCEGPSNLSITAYDACTGANVRFRFQLFLDMDNNGSMETVVSSNNPPPAGMVYYNNAFNPNFSGGTLRAFDSRSVPPNQKYNFSIHETVVGNKRTAAVQWKTAAQLPNPGNLSGLPGILPELPYGRHKIKWLVEDGCTNESTCEYGINVQDCKPPTVVCTNGLSGTITAVGMLQLWASDFLQYTDDNCTPSAFLKLGIRRSGAGNGFPLDAAGNPVTSITFDCSEIGSQPVELWSMDLAGNADYCETIIVVQDKLGVCGASVQVSGKLATETSQGVEAAALELAGSSPFAPAFSFLLQSDSSGNFEFPAVPMAQNVSLTPTKDDNPLNGVTTFDLVEITKHILGIKPLDSPYKMIAADANHSNSITSFDIIELRKLILGIYNSLPNNTSWRFVDKAYTFLNPDNPFQADFPENIASANLQTSLADADFIAVKIGDVNNTAVANSNTDAVSRGTGPEPIIFVADAPGQKYWQFGEEFNLGIQSAESLLGYQFTLKLHGLELLEIIPGENMRQEFFAHFPEKDAITVACDKRDAAAFWLRCRVTENGYLHQMLSINSSITQAEAYSAETNGQRHAVALQFSAPGQFQVYPPQPNPFSDKTSLAFFMPQPGDASLKLMDGNGQLLLEQRKTFPKGFNAFEIDFQGQGISGLLFYKIESAAGTGAGKLIRVP